jgi:hypothetical protein
MACRAALLTLIVLAIAVEGCAPEETRRPSSALLSPLLAPFTDDFDDNSVDMNRWQLDTPVDCVPEEKNQRVELSCTAACTNEYTHFITRAPFDMRDNEVVVELVDPGNQSNTKWTPTFHLFTPGDNRVAIAILGGALRLRNKLAGVIQPDLATVTLDGGQRWLRIQEAAGTLSTAWSQDGISWVQLGSEPDPFSFATTQVFLEAGCFGTLGSPTHIVFDNFNLPPNPDAGGFDGGTPDAGGSDGGTADAGGGDGGSPDAGRPEQVEPARLSLGCGCDAEGGSWNLGLGALALGSLRRRRGQ